MPLPPHSQALLQKGLELQGRGNHAEAAKQYARLRIAAPREFDGWNLGGHAALAIGHATEAVALLTRALQLKPGATDTAITLSVAHLASGQFDQAETLLRALVEQHPERPEVWRYLGLVHETRNQPDLAAAARQRVVTLAPESFPGWIDYGSTLSLLGRQTDALNCFLRAHQLDPGNPRARVGAAMVLLRCHRVREAAAVLDDVIQRHPADQVSRSFRLTALHNLADVTREQLLAEHRAYGAVVGPAVNTAWPQQREPDRKLRVGILSRDLYEHSVAYFLEPLLRHLDRNRFEVVAYSDNARADATTGRLRATVAVWRDVAGHVDAAVEQQVRADSIDILVDLAGHTASNRLPLLARRLAPVQATYLGYPDTTGVPAIDYRIVDVRTDPAPEADRYATETLVRMGECGWAYQPPESAPPVAPCPSESGRPPTFGCFNNFGKVTDSMLLLWARILEAVPGSRLLIKAAGLAEPAVLDPIRTRLLAAGLASDRVELRAQTPDTASHLAAYGEVDVALDTFPYHGTTTTCEALWMGVPVITLAGDRHCARVGLSLLSAVGHPEWVASSTDEYTAIAAGLALAPARLRAARQGLRAAMSASPLLDHAGQAKRFGAALQRCWSEAIGHSR